MPEEQGRRRGLPGEEAKALHRQVSALVEAEGAMAPVMQQFQAVWGDRGPAIHDHDGAQALRVPRCEGHGIVPAHGVPHQDHPLPPETFYHPHEVGGEILGSVGGRIRPLARPVTPLVQRQNVVTVGKGGSHLIPPVTVGGAAVEKEKRRESGAPPLEAVKAEAIHLKKTAAGKAAAEEIGTIHTLYSYHEDAKPTIPWVSQKIWSAP